MDVHDGFLLYFPLLFLIVFIVGQFDCPLLFFRQLSYLEVSKFAWRLPIIADWAIDTGAGRFVGTCLLEHLLDCLELIVGF